MMVRAKKTHRWYGVLALAFVIPSLSPFLVAAPARGADSSQTVCPVDPATEEDIKLKRAILYAALGEQQQANSIVQEIENPERQMEAVALAAAYAGQYEQAFRQPFDEDILLRPENVFEKIARQAVNAKKFDELQQGAKAAQVSDRVMETIAWIYIQQEAYDGALELIENIQSPRLQGELLLKLAENYGQKGQDKKFLDILAKINQLAVSYGQDYYRIYTQARVAKLYAEAGETRLAVDAISATPVETMVTGSRQGEARLMLADAYAEAGEREKAIALVAEVEQESASLSDNFDKARAWLGIAVNYAQLGEYDRAFAVIKAMEKESASGWVVPFLTAKNQALVEIAIAYAAAGRGEEAINLARTIEPLADSQKVDLNTRQPLIYDFDENSDRDNAMLGIALAFAKRGMLTEALQLVESLEGDGKKPEILVEIARFYLKTDQQKPAVAVAEAIAAKPLFPPVMLGVLGVEYAEAGMLETGLKLANSIQINNFLEIEVKTGALERIAARLAAAGKYKEAREVANSFDKCTDKTKLLLVIATEYAAAGKTKEANGIVAALPEFRSVNEFADIIQQLTVEAEKQREAGEFDASLSALEKRLALVEAMGDRQQQGFTLRSLALTYDEKGDLNKALDFHQKTLALYQQIGDKGWESDTLLHLANLEVRREEFASAIDHYQQCLAIYEAFNYLIGQATTWMYIGNAYTGKQDNPAAVAAYEKSLAILAQANVADNRELIDILKQKVYGYLGLVLINSGDFAKARTVLTEAIKHRESRFASYKGNDAARIQETESNINTYQLNPYTLLQYVLLEQKEIESALEIADRSRGRAFVELLAERITSEEEKSNPNIQRALTEPLNISQIRQLATEQNSTLVVYTFDQQISNTVLIWVVQPDGKVAFRESDFGPDISLADVVERTRVAAATDTARGGGETPMQEIVSETRESVAPKRNRRLSPTRRLQQLHSFLIEPIADLLPTDPQEPVIFIPQGELFLVPFAGLLDSNGKYLIEKHTILTAPSLQVLALTAKNQNTVSGNPLIVGNPTMPYEPGTTSTSTTTTRDRLAPLPAAEAEAKEIASLLGTEAIIGDDATEANITKKLPEAGIIHLATHGLLDDIEGLGVPGAIALTPADNGDGFLTSLDILSLDLKASLVVLSACDTGRGRITGDGVLGLSRSFMTAGIPNVLVSLWQVPDAPTGEMMTEFYRQLEQTGDKSHSLRQAMLSTMKKYPEPQNWAAFVMMGAPR
ncbi:CHAT domain-containing protein [[Phormidium] sp. ETS-05]|uniref:CHAT domain-containing protein n=1 Tax=[Phormidium] sp. ETS-05 TaxID=222819 RepID=UPI0018EEF20C|nr:CHAT domain-containing protein [[Phormidium] sp. ETS-05]